MRASLIEIKGLHAISAGAAPRLRQNTPKLPVGRAAHTRRGLHGQPRARRPVQHPRWDLDLHRAGLVHAHAVRRGLPTSPTSELRVYLLLMPRMPGIPDRSDASGMVSVSWGCTMRIVRTKGWTTGSSPGPIRLGRPSARSGAGRGSAECSRATNASPRSSRGPRFIALRPPDRLWAHRGRLLGIPIGWLRPMSYHDHLL